MTLIYLALGSNVGSSQDNIAMAIKLLGASLSDIKSAPIYVSKAVGYTDQDDFLNTVISANTDLPPRQLLDFIKRVEKEVGRVKRFRWGPREIDIDIIFYGDRQINEPGLNIPHARYAERDFVLRPLIDLDPSISDPVSHKRVDEVYKLLPQTEHSIVGLFKSN